MKVSNVSVLRVVFATCLAGVSVGCDKDGAGAAASSASPAGAAAPVATAGAVANAKAASSAVVAATAEPTEAAGSEAPSSPGVMLNDGLPAEIPSGTSKPPTVAEWDAVPREVTVRRSTERGCETKMLREWLRVSCRPKGTLQATSVATVESGGQQAFAGMFGDRASVVVQVVRGKKYTARFTWNDGVVGTLVVDWPSGAPRPVPFRIE